MGSASPSCVSAAAGGEGQGGSLGSPTDHLPRTGPALSARAKREEEGAQRSHCLPTRGLCLSARRNLYGGSNLFPTVWLLGPAPCELRRQLGVRLSHGAPCHQMAGAQCTGWGRHRWPTASGVCHSTTHRPSECPQLGDNTHGRVSRSLQQPTGQQPVPVQTEPLSVTSLGGKAEWRGPWSRGGWGGTSEGPLIKVP